MEGGGREGGTVAGMHFSWLNRLCLCTIYIHTCSMTGSGLLVTSSENRPSSAPNSTYCTAERKTTALLYHTVRELNIQA